MQTRRAGSDTGEPASLDFTLAVRQRHGRTIVQASPEAVVPAARRPWLQRRNGMIKDKVVIITSGSSGIGEATADCLPAKVPSGAGPGRADWLQRIADGIRLDGGEGQSTRELDIARRKTMSASYGWPWTNSAGWTSSSTPA